jgi:hypothetical protein
MTVSAAAAIVMVLGTIAGGHQAQSATAKPTAPQGFSVVLLLGDTQGGSAQDNVPVTARKALADLKDFLPYKSYRLLDTQWISCCGQSAIVSRLRGADDQDYDLDLNPSPGPNGKWAIHFILRDPAPAAPSGGGFSGALRDKEIYVLTAQRNDLERKLADLRQKLNDGHPEVIELKAQIADVVKRLDVIRLDDLTRRVSTLRDGRRAMIDTSFAMDVGETVVVGTSRLKGEKALIALLTAIPQRR